jgi:Holliday junction resolvase RusA-like endonuclease
MSNELKKNQFFYNKFPCKITIESISHDKRRADIDNKATSILDLLVDNKIIPDDNKFVVQELDIRNVGYAKNLALTKVVIEPYKEDVLELDQDFKEENWLNYIDLFIN